MLVIIGIIDYSISLLYAYLSGYTRHITYTHTYTHTHTYILYTHIYIYIYIYVFFLFMKLIYIYDIVYMYYREIHVLVPSDHLKCRYI